MDDKKPTKDKILLENCRYMILEGDRYRQATMNGREAQKTPPYFQMTDRKETPLYVGFRMI